MKLGKHILKLKRLGIITYRKAVVYIHAQSYICKAEGFETESRIKITLNKKRYILATLQVVTADFLKPDEVGLSEYAWELLGGKEGADVFLSHPDPLLSTCYIRELTYGRKLKPRELTEIITDLGTGRLPDTHIAAFLAALAAVPYDPEVVFHLTKAMLKGGDQLHWDRHSVIVDKHCVGGLPGNRTTLIIVPIVAAFGLLIPKTSSRAITSAAGTADTMGILAPVELKLNHIKKVVAKENGCIVWGGLANLSPADDVLICVERSLDLNSQSQMVASILSKKIAAGSTHVLLDIPVGNTAKITTEKEALILRNNLQAISERFGIHLHTVITGGMQPIGSGIGPALEAQDVLAVLQNKTGAPQDLRDRALLLAGQVLEFSPLVKAGDGLGIATQLLQSGAAWKKFQAICEAQGGMRTPGIAPYRKDYLAPRSGKITAIDNRRASELAKLAGAPYSKLAGIYLHAKIGTKIIKGDPLLTIHAESPGELDYALAYLTNDGKMFKWGGKS